MTTADDGAGYRGHVTRIIAGAAGSVPLAVPDAGTRPTSDRVRESLFATLDSWGIIEGSRVLDLYAGSGALGLEAVSRGAASADLVERAQSAAQVITRNIRSIAKAVPGAQVRVHRRAADAFLAATSETFDVVFIDPPYDLGETELSATLQALDRRLREDAVIIIERAARSPEPGLPDTWELTRHKRYGDTALWWASRPAQPMTPSQSR